MIYTNYSTIWEAEGSDSSKPVRDIKQNNKKRKKVNKIKKSNNLNRHSKNMICRLPAIPYYS